MPAMAPVLSLSVVASDTYDRTTAAMPVERGMCTCKWIYQHAAYSSTEWETDLVALWQLYALHCKDVDNLLKAMACTL